jgi:hypothetical protein
LVRRAQRKILYNIRTLEKGTLGSEYHMHNPRISFTINDRMFTGTAQIVEQDKEPELTGSFKVDEYKIWLE